MPTRKLLTLGFFVAAGAQSNDTSTELGLGPLITNQIPPKTAFEVATCVVDVGQATVSLGEAGDAMNAAEMECSSDNIETTEGKTACAVQINYIMATTLYVVSYFSAAANDCAMSVNLPALCAADISGFLNGLASAAGAGAGLAGGSCKSHSDSVEVFRRLETHKGSVLPAFLSGRAPKVESNVDRKRATALAFCVFNVLQASLFLTRATLLITSSVKDCDPTYVGEKVIPDEKGRRRAQCSVDIGGLIGSFAYVSAYIGATLNNCPVNPIYGASCAADVSAVITAFGSVTSSGASLSQTCGKLRNS